MWPSCRCADWGMRRGRPHPTPGLVAGLAHAKEAMARRAVTPCRLDHDAVRRLVVDLQRQFAHQMEALGVNMKQTELDKPKVLRADGVFSGKTILFTGTLSQMGRKEAQEMAEAQGAKNISAVSGNLDILVVGENAGSKLDKAKKLGTVQIMTEEEFIQLVTA